MVLGVSAAPAREGVFPGRSGKIAVLEVRLVGDSLVEHMATLNADGSGYRVLRPGLQPSRPRWSPDGRKLVFTTGLDFGQIPNSIRVMNASGSGLKTVFGLAAQNRNDLSVGSPDWLPGGDIVFFGNRGSRSGVYRIHADGTSPRRLARLSDVGLEHGGPTLSHLVASPDGRRVAFFRAQGAYSFAVWVMKLNGSGLRKLAAGCFGRGANLDWSPNGTQLLGAWEDYEPMHGCGPDSGLFLMSPRGGTPRRIYTEKYENIGPGESIGNCPPMAAFSPNSKQIAFAVQRRSFNSSLCDTIMVMPASGGDPSIIHQAGGGCCKGYFQPAWQPLRR